MKLTVRALLGATALVSAGMVANAETITIATVNNGDMIRMQGYTDDFTAKTGHTVEWVTLEENVLRQRVTTDISTKGGAFDIMTIGMYETPIWGANDWLVPLDDLSEEYDVGDILPAMSGGLSHDGVRRIGPSQVQVIPPEHCAVGSCTFKAKGAGSIRKISAGRSRSLATDIQSWQVL